MTTRLAILCGAWVSLIVTLVIVFFFETFFLFIAVCLLAVCAGIIFVRSRQSNSGPIALLVVTSFLFLWGRPIIATLDQSFDISYLELLDGVVMTTGGQIVYLQTMLVSMVTFSCTLFFLSLSGNFGNARGKELHSLQKGEPTAGAWHFIFYCGVLFSLLQAALFLKHFLSGGSYYDIFLVGKDTVTFPGVSSLAGLLFVGYVGIFVFTNSSRKILWRYTVAFIVISLLQLIKGSRGEIFSQLLVSVWLYYFCVRRSPRLFHMAGAFLALVALAELVSFLRAGNIEQLGRDKSIISAFEWFIYSQGVSGQLVGVAIEYFDTGISAIRFIVSPLLNPIRKLFDPEFGGQTAVYGESSGLFAHEISWRLSPDMYLAGHGVGSSYVAEAFLLMGLVGVVIASSFLIYLVADPRGLFVRSKVRFFVFCYALPYVLFTPRESLVFAVVPAVKAGVFFWIVRAIYARFNHRRHTDLQPCTFVDGNCAKLSATRRCGDNFGG